MNGQMTAQIGDETKKPKSNEWNGFRKPKVDKHVAKQERKNTRRFLQNIRGGSRLSNGVWGDENE